MIEGMSERESEWAGGTTYTHTCVITIIFFSGGFTEGEYSILWYYDEQVRIISVKI